jgi:hypothetical protein
MGVRIEPIEGMGGCVTTSTGSANHSEEQESVAAAKVHFLARQPILDLRGRVHGFKLLFRDDPKEGGSASRAMIESAAFHKLD